MKLSARIVSAWPEVEALFDDWRALLPQTSADSLFLTPEWIQAWRVAVEGVPLQPQLVHVTNSDGATVGIAPFYLMQQYLAGALPLTTLRVMGDFPTGAVYSDVIAQPGLEDEVYACVLDAVAAISPDAVWLPHTATWTGAVDRIVSACPDTYTLLSRSNTLFYVELPDTYEAYEQMLSKSTRKDFRRADRKLSEQVETELCRCPAALPEHLEQFMVLNSKRWAEEDTVGVFERKPREARFYRAFAPVALERGWLRLMRMMRDGQPVASEIGYAYRGRYYAMQAGCDPDGPPGAGKVLLNRMLRQVLEDGTRCFDFMTGDTDYKRRYAAQTRETKDLFLLRKSLKTLPMRLAGIWARGRYLDIANPRTHLTS